MTEVAVYETPRAQLIDYQTAAVQRLTEWAASAQAAHSVAVNLVNTSFVPPAFRNKPDEATAAILAGLEVGLAPLASLRAFDVIQNQAAPRAITLRAIVQSFGHEIELVESTSTQCKMRGRRRGSQTWQSVKWTMDRAKELGLTSKSNWKQQPAAMLIARATSEICRIIAADAILGIGYSSEEVLDGAVGDPLEPAEIPDAAPEPTTRRMSYKAPTDEPAAPEPEAADAVHEPHPDSTSGGPKMITQSQSRMLHALLNETGNGNRDTGLAYIVLAVGHDITTSKDLTRDEASTVIDQLQADKDADTFPDEDTGGLL